MASPRLLFIAGLPASGKSYFGDWLADHHNYNHIDAELAGHLENAGALHLWDEAVQRTDATVLATHLLVQSKPTVLSWGFPPSMLSFVAALKTAGFHIWWFNAAAGAARIEYARTGLPLAPFDRQLARIRQAQAAILALFGSNVITTLEPSGRRTAPETTYAAICDAT